MMRIYFLSMLCVVFSTCPALSVELDQEVNSEFFALELFIWNQHTKQIGDRVQYAIKGDSVGDSQFLTVILRVTPLEGDVLSIIPIMTYRGLSPSLITSMDSDKDKNFPILVSRHQKDRFRIECFYKGQNIPFDLAALEFLKGSVEVDSTDKRNIRRVGGFVRDIILMVAWDRIDSGMQIPLHGFTPYVLSPIMMIDEDLGFYVEEISVNLNRMGTSSDFFLPRDPFINRITKVNKDPVEAITIDEIASLNRFVEGVYVENTIKANRTSLQTVTLSDYNDDLHIFATQRRRHFFTVSSDLDDSDSEGGGSFSTQARLYVNFDRISKEELQELRTVIPEKIEASRKELDKIMTESNVIKIESEKSPRDVE